MSDKEKVINIAFIGILGISMVFLSNFFKSSVDIDDKGIEQHENKTPQVQSTVEDNYYRDYQTSLQSDLKKILSQIEGVGNVDVMITFDTLEQKEIAYNIKESNNVTSERDNQGGERVVEESDSDQSAIMVSKDGANEPLIITENYPAVKGVIVVAQGASNPDVKYKLMKGIEFALDIPSYKIKENKKKN